MSSALVKILKECPLIQDALEHYKNNGPSEFQKMESEFWRDWWKSTEGLYYPVPDLANKELKAGPDDTQNKGDDEVLK